MGITTAATAFHRMAGMPRRVSSRTRTYRRTYIREWRKHRGLSMDRLVDRVREYLEGFSKSTLSRVENAKQGYTQPMLEAIALALNTEPQNLLMRTPDSEIWSLIDNLESLPPDDRQRVAAIVETFRKAS